MLDQSVSAEELKLQELRDKTKAVQELMELDSLNITDVDLKRVAQLEEDARTLTPLQRLKKMAKEQEDYSRDKMQQRFSSIKSIKNYKGLIYIEVDSHDSRRAATEEAIKVLGLDAPHTEFMDYVASRTYHDTIMSVETFMRNIKLLVTMATMAPEYFSKGGGELKDLMKEAREAVKEARKYIKKEYLSKLPKETAAILVSRNFSTEDPKLLGSYLEPGWDKAIRLERDTAADMETMKKLVNLE